MYRQAATRNGAIDLLKFLFSWIVAFYHFYSNRKYFPHGNIGVEFFVLVSGVYFYMSWEKTKRRRPGEDLAFYPYEYAKKRFLRFFPSTTTAFVGAFIVIGLMIQGIHKKSLFSFLGRCCDLIWEILLIGVDGVW